MQKDELVAYWLDTANRDYQTVKHLYDSGDYHWSLLMGHLVIEKLLKAVLIACQPEGTSVPRSHDLLLLAEKSGIGMTQRQKDLLDLTTTFNVAARYPDYARWIRASNRRWAATSRRAVIISSEAIHTCLPAEALVLSSLYFALHSRLCPRYEQPLQRRRPAR